MIQFLLNDEMVELTSFAPSLTALDWLRTKKGKMGSKEGCGSGDCGACTVVVGDLVAGQWQYKSINACLLLLGNLHGKHLLTVEALTSKRDPALTDLHPVQRAMVEHHGSQCGFCTPGFIMSLLALYMNHDSYPGKEITIHALGGNLCRCTGYQPILKAAEDCFRYQVGPEQDINHPEHRFSKQVQLLTHSLNTAMASNLIPFVEHQEQHFYLPQTLDQLCQLKAMHPQARFVAGATDLAVSFNQQMQYSEQLISVRYCPELMQFNQNDDGLCIGAALPYSDFIDPFCEIYPEASELFARLGSKQVRNAGSLGGSIANASPIGDPAPLLMALDATLEVHSIRGQRRIALTEFFVGYRQTRLEEDEVIVAIHIPKRPADQQLSCYKISKRMEDDISAVCLVLSYQLQDEKMEQVKCMMGGMAATPAAGKYVAAALNGQAFSLENLQRAAQYIESDFKPLSDVRASAAYRLQVTKNLFDRIWYQHPTNALTATRIEHAAL